MTNKTENDTEELLDVKEGSVQDSGNKPNAPKPSNDIDDDYSDVTFSSDQFSSKPFSNIEKKLHPKNKRYKPPGMPPPQEAHVPTDENRKLVHSLAGLGVPHNDICTIIGVSKMTLYKYYKSELDKGLAQANAKIAGSLFKQAMEGNVAAAIFWTKVRMGWSERQNQGDGTVKVVIVNDPESTKLSKEDD